MLAAEAEHEVITAGGEPGESDHIIATVEDRRETSTAKLRDTSTVERNRLIRSKYRPRKTQGQRQCDNFEIHLNSPYEANDQEHANGATGVAPILSILKMRACTLKDDSTGIADAAKDLNFFMKPPEMVVNRITTSQG
jgi:hypothetical protein